MPDPDIIMDYAQTQYLEQRIVDLEAKYKRLADRCREMVLKSVGVSLINRGGKLVLIRRES